MNERIKELWENCDEIHTRYPKKGSPIYASPELLEKFAELIVGECAKAAAQTPCPYEDEFAKQTYGHTWDMACVESAKEIRKKFGVEE